MKRYPFFFQKKCLFSACGIDFSAVRFPEHRAIWKSTLLLSERVGSGACSRTNSTGTRLFNFVDSVNVLTKV